MTDNERYYTTKVYLDRLAKGMDPLTGEDLPLDTVLNNVYVCRAFALASEVFDEVIKNGCRVTPNKDRRERLAFSITEQQRDKIVVTESPVSVTVIARRVERVLDKDVKPLVPTKITEWLESEGFLTTIVGQDGKHTRVATENGESLGIVTKEENLRGEIIKKSYYDINAQAFVVANLDKIAEQTDERRRFGDREKTEEAAEEKTEEKEKEESPAETPPEKKKKTKKKDQPSEPKSA